MPYNPMNPINTDPNMIDINLKSDLYGDDVEIIKG